METFEKFCRDTGIDNEMGKEASQLWQSVQKTVMVGEKLEGPLLHWIECSVYIILCNKRCQEKHASKHKYPTVTQLLKAGNLRLVEFFLKLKKILKLTPVTNQVGEAIEAIEKKFLVAVALFNKLKGLWPSIVTEGASELQRAEKFSRCWLLFIVIKAQQADARCDLMTAFHVLLCCINHVLNPSSAECASTAVKSTFLQNVSISLCIPLSKIEAVYAKFWLPFIKHSPQCSQDVSLQTLYQELYEQHGDFDERLFLKEDEHLKAVPTNGHKGQRKIAETREVQREVAPENNEESRSLLVLATSELPSTTLSRFWNNCRRNPTHFILGQLKDAEKVFTEALLRVIGEDKKERAIELYTRGKKLYLRVMESMLLAEEKRLNCSDFSALLNSEAFNKALLVCSLEVSLVSSGQAAASQLAFPWILTVFGIKPYDFFKVIESFVIHEVLLTSSTVKHLNSVEESIVESLAWKTGSPLIEALKKFYPVSSDAGPSANGESNTKKCQPLNLFLRKVNQLAYMRLTALCSQLKIPQEQVLDTWTCLEHSIRLKWELMQDRHLDQMILCAIYSTSKALETDIQFKQVVQLYKSLPHAKTQVYKNVLISEDERDTIIGFYNRVYMPVMKSIILQFTGKRAKPPASPVPTRNSSTAATSPSRPLPGKKNIYVSPLKKALAAALSPVSKSLYSFGDSPGSGDRASLSRINESMRAETLRTASVAQSTVHKRLRFEDEGTSPGSALTRDYVLIHNPQRVPSERTRDNQQGVRTRSETTTSGATPSDGNTGLTGLGSGLTGVRNNSSKSSTSTFKDGNNNTLDS